MVGPRPHSDDKQRVLDATDIVQLIGEQLTLRPKGREFVCLCPFHDDHKPSMYVVPNKQIYHCFSCGAGGNAFDFVMRHHGMTFREALEHLAQRAGVELTRTRPCPTGAGHGSGDDAQGSCSQGDLAAATAFAADFFRTIFRHEAHGAAARAIVERRGISPEMVDAFGIGAAPDRWDGLLSTIQRKGLGLQPFIECGLLKARPGGDGYYDAFRNRVIFPIMDRTGRAIAFGGRKIDEQEEPKYLNSPESAVFDKSSTLYGLHHATREIQRQRRAIVTEGYTDVIACHQAGVSNVVATLGTALTAKHARSLRHLCDSVVFLFDGDEAGQKAADRAFEVFFLEPVEVRIAILPEGADPDDVLKRPGGADAFRAIIAQSIDALTYRFKRLESRLQRQDAQPGSAARTRIVEEETRRLVSMGLHDLSPMQRAGTLRRLAALARVDERSVIDTARLAGRARAAHPEASGSGARTGDRRLSPVENALGCLLVEPKLIESFPTDVRDILGAGGYPSDPLRWLAEAVSACVEQGHEPSLRDLMSELESEEARRLAAELACEVERVTEGSPERVARHWEACVLRWRLDRERVSRSVAAGTEAPSSIEEMAEQLERLRRINRELGGDPRAMPRPAAT